MGGEQRTPCHPQLGTRASGVAEAPGVARLTFSSPLDTEARPTPRATSRAASGAGCAGSSVHCGPPERPDARTCGPSPIRLDVRPSCPAEVLSRPRERPMRSLSCVDSRGRQFATRGPARGPGAPSQELKRLEDADGACGLTQALARGAGFPRSSWCIPGSLAAPTGGPALPTSSSSSPQSCCSLESAKSARKLVSCRGHRVRGRRSATRLSPAPPPCECVRSWGDRAEGRTTGRGVWRQTRPGSPLEPRASTTVYHKQLAYGVGTQASSLRLPVGSREMAPRSCASGPIARCICALRSVPEIGAARGRAGSRRLAPRPPVGHRPATPPGSSVLRSHRAPDSLGRRMSILVRAGAPNRLVSSARRAPTAPNCRARTIHRSPRESPASRRVRSRRTSSSTKRIPWTGTHGATKRSSAPGARTSQYSWCAHA